MSALTVNNVRVAGLSACVPEKVEENLTLKMKKRPKRLLRQPV